MLVAVNSHASGNYESNINTEAGFLIETRLIEIIHHGKDSVYVRGTLRDGDLIVNSGTGRIVPGQSVRIASTTPVSNRTGS